MGWSSTGPSRGRGNNLEVFLEAMRPHLAVEARINAGPSRVFEKSDSGWLPRAELTNSAARAFAGGKAKDPSESKLFFAASWASRPVKGRVWEPPAPNPSGESSGREVWLATADLYRPSLFATVWVVRDATKVSLREEPNGYISGVAYLLSQVKEANAFAAEGGTLNRGLEKFLEKFERDQAQLKPKPKPKTKPKPKPRQRQGQGRRQRRNNNRR